MPDITMQLQEQILTAGAEGRKLNIVGGGTKGFMGRPPLGDVVQVGEHQGIVNYQPVELVLTARAGTTISEVEAVLDEQGQMLAFDPPRLGGAATLGGTLACNLSGPGRPWQGSIRDHVLGIRLINGRGEHLRFGGQVMKNVAGYDVSRLMAGAMGTLGLMTEISLKVLPKPAHQLTLVEEMDLDRAVRIMNKRAGEPKPLSAACWVDGKLYTRLSGASASVEATAATWSGRTFTDGEAFWRQLREQEIDFFTGDTPLWRFSVKSTAPQPQVDGNWLVDWGGAQRWLRAEGDLESFEGIATEMGGQVSLFRGGDRNQEVFHRQPDPLHPFQQRLKDSFDPMRIFNPGRLYSWL